MQAKSDREEVLIQKFTSSTGLYLGSALNYTLVQPLPLEMPSVITVCTCVSVQTDADNWVFHKKDTITV